MAIRKNTNPTPMQLQPGLLDILVRNGMQASIVWEANNRPQLVVRGHDSPVLAYDLTDKQLKALTGWGTNYANKSAYNTFADIVAKDFDLPKNYVHARNANGRVAMGLHGYRIGAGEYGRPEVLTPRQAIQNGIPLSPRIARPRGIWGVITPFLGWTTRQQDGFHLRRMGGQLVAPNGAPIVMDRPDGRMKPGELQSGGYGFYYKGQPSDARSVVQDPLMELKEAFVPLNEKVERPNVPAKPYKELITSPVYFSGEKFMECLDSHGIVIDAKEKTMTIQSAKLDYDLTYDLNEEEVKKLTSNSAKEHKVEDRLATINQIISADFTQPITQEMLNSNQRIAIDVMPDVQTEISRQQIGDMGATQERVSKPDVALQRTMPFEADGKVIPILSEKDGFHWQQEAKHGRDVVLENVVAYENRGHYYLRADVNGKEVSKELTEEEFKEFHYRNDDRRLEILDKHLDGIVLERGDYKGEFVNSSQTNGERLAELKESHGWFREGKDGREVSVENINVQPIAMGKYKMSAIIDGEVISHEINQKDFNKFMAMDDYHRMKLFAKIFDEVDIKDKIGVGTKIGAALAAAVTVMQEVTIGLEPGMGPDRMDIPATANRAYFKPGVDRPCDVAMRNYEAAIITDEIHNTLKM